MNIPELNSPLLQNQFFLMALAAWSIIWKGLALWKAAKNDQKYWYLAILVVNTVGLLEIFYLVWFANKDRLWEKILKKVTKR